MAFCFMAFLCLFATATADTPHNFIERNFIEAWREANWRLLIGAESLFTWSIVALAFPALLAWSRARSSGFRLGLTLFVFLLPVTFAIVTGDLDKIFTWCLATIGTPFATFDLLFRRQDGEFYAEGILVFLALGWWTILWAALFVRELRHRKRGRVALVTNQQAA
jgi:hypothetical protein